MKLHVPFYDSFTSVFLAFAFKYRFHRLSQLCGGILRFPMDVLIFECQVANMMATTVLFIFALGTWLYQSNYSYIRLHVRIFSIVLFWNVRHIVIEKCIKFGKEYRSEIFPKDFSNDTIRRMRGFDVRKVYGIWEHDIYEDQQFIDIAICEVFSLTLADVWLVLIKFLTLWVVFELAIEPCLIIGFQKLKVKFKK
uniref:Uncharacterized protein n=1 Tax=Glossina palpalis gambiensis TaxID=67801 RepID=A0A1B0BX58_9MUSC